ncbi:MAG: hypothetical protein QNJ40_26250 [Xanthomonadales bacterium]|nr:hypothetical protein [Xanthomonadales bacterium]
MTDIFFYDSTPSPGNAGFAHMGPYFTRTLHGNIPHQDMARMQVNAVITQLETLARQHRQGFRFIVFLDHGNVNNQQLGNGMLNLTATNRTVLQRIGRVRCQRIYFLGCMLSRPAAGVASTIGRLVGRDVVGSQATVYAHTANGMSSDQQWLRFRANGTCINEPNQTPNLSMSRFRLQIRP